MKLSHSSSPLPDRWWDFGADTIINTNKAVRLTQDQPSEMGWLWSRLPLTSTSYQVEFEFKVRAVFAPVAARDRHRVLTPLVGSGTGQVDSKASAIFGDGFAMWLTKERAQPCVPLRFVFIGLEVADDELLVLQWPRLRVKRSVPSQLSVRAGRLHDVATRHARRSAYPDLAACLCLNPPSDQFNGLGLFFDTYANSRHSYTFPRVSAMLGDGKRSYDLATDGAVSEFAGCSVRFRRSGLLVVP